MLDKTCKHRSLLLIVFLVLTSLFVMPLKAMESLSPERLLDLDFQDLMDVKIISGSKHYESVKNLPASAIVITRKEIQQMGYLTLEEVLSSVPGLYPVDFWESDGIHLGVRGFFTDTWNRNVVFMINGVSQREGFNSSNNFSIINLPVSAIERIEIIRGPASVVYGSGAFFGSINIITVERDKRDDQSAISASFGNSLSEYTANLSGGNDNNAYSFVAAFQKDAGLDVPYSSMAHDTIETSGNTSLGDTESESHHFSYTGHFSDFFASVSFDETVNSHPFLFVPTSEYNGEANYMAARAAVGVNKKVVQGFNISSQLSFRHNRVEFFYDTDLLPDLWERQDLNSKLFKFEINALFTPVSFLEILGGYDFERIREVYTTYDLPLFGLNRFEETTGDGDINLSAYYLQSKVSISNRLKLVAGVRAQTSDSYTIYATRNNGSEGLLKASRNFEGGHWDLIPRFALIGNITDNHLIKLLYGEAFNHPEFVHTRDFVFRPTTQSVTEEHIRTYEINYIGNLTENLSISSSAFFNKVDGIIARSNGFDSEGEYYSVWKNDGDFETLGLEIQSIMQLNENLVVDFALTFQKTEDLNKGIRPGFSPDHLANIKIYYKIKSDMGFGIAANAVSDMDAQWDTAVEDVSDPTSPEVGRVSKQVGSYVVVNANYWYEPTFFQNIHLNFKVNNLLDRDYRFPTNTNQPWAWKGLRAKGREFNLGISYRF